ncbi:MAG TPA: metal-dependent transcriptional regulator [Thermoanaerobaculia bacterium]|nr:metal-dependent transcriptional regulator [Thermoanaerobaculia bacterium]
MIHPIADEVLERLWYAKEDGRAMPGIEELQRTIGNGSLAPAVAQLESDEALRAGAELELLPAGEARARGIVRRHRLAEILFAEVMDVALSDAEASACELEHILSERVVDRVCTFLGHPPKCPHQKSIPRGECCRVFETKVEPLTTRLFDLPIGSSGTVVFIAPKSPARLNRLAVLGVVPGTEVRLLGRRPSVTLACGQTTLAIEDEMAKEIWVR